MVRPAEVDATLLQLLPSSLQQLVDGCNRMAPYGGDGGGGDGGGEDDATAQMVKPVAVTDPSVDHDIVCPALMLTPLGPEVPT